MLKRTPSVAIIYGFAEGPVIGKKLINNLQRNGFCITNNAHEADFIIAHSGGIYLIPEKHKAELILLDAPSIGDTDTWKNLQVKKAKIDYNHARETNQRIQWFYKSFLNLFYLFLKLPYELKMLKGYLHHNHTLPNITGSHVIVISHINDPWSSIISKNESENHSEYTFITHTGVHDDLWLNPEFYINLLK